jgi:large subunit ribosomal protein L29
MRVSELRELTMEELRAKDEELRRELLNLRFQLAAQQIESPMRIRAVRKDIARVKTLIRERELEAQSSQALVGQADEGAAEES